jgi:ATP-dependent HslUV protease subunit HslV
MTTIVAVKKDGFAAIAADSLTSWGNVTESARHIANHHKIVRYGDNYFAFAGSSAFKVIFAHWLSKLEHELSFDNVQNIFESWLEFHHQLKNEYYLRELTTMTTSSSRREPAFLSRIRMGYSL